MEKPAVNSQLGAHVHKWIIPQVCTTQLLDSTAGRDCFDFSKSKDGAVNRGVTSIADLVFQVSHNYNSW